MAADQGVLVEAEALEAEEDLEEEAAAVEGALAIVGADTGVVVAVAEVVVTLKASSQERACAKFAGTVTPSFPLRNTFTTRIPTWSMRIPVKLRGEHKAGIV